MNSDLAIYEDINGEVKINAHFGEDDIWVSKYKIAEIYNTSRQNIEKHIQNIYKDKELSRKVTCKDLLQVQKEGTRQVKRSIEHYNLDMIISLGYRIQSDYI